MEVSNYSDYEKLKTVHVFDYFDIPLFFISVSPEDEYFLNYYIEEVAGNVDKWFFGRISHKERKDLIEQRVSTIKILNRLLEKERLYHLYINPNLKEPDASIKCEIVNKDNFDPESFPEKDFYVNYDYVSETKLTKIEEDVLDSSKFKVVLKDARNSHDIGLDIFVDFLSNIKKSVNEIANDVGSKLIGKESVHSINLRVDSLQPSSFGIWLRTDKHEADLFEVPEKSINNLFRIINSIKHESPQIIEEQIEIDEEYSLDTIKSLKVLLKDITDNNFTMKLEGRTKDEKEVKTVKFDRDSYNKLDILTKILEKHSEEYTEKLEVEGLLTSVNTSYNNFRISTIKMGDISGKMSKDIIDKLKVESNLQFRVPSFIKATLIKKVVNDLVEGHHSEKYELVSFEQPD